MTSAASYALGDLLAWPGSQVRGNCLVSLGTSTVSLPGRHHSRKRARPGTCRHGRNPRRGIRPHRGGPAVHPRSRPRPDAGNDRRVPAVQPGCLPGKAGLRQPPRRAEPQPVLPGTPWRRPTARLAAWLWENLLARADYYVGCHCGDFPRRLTPSPASAPDRTASSVSGHVPWRTASTSHGSS